MRCSGRNRRLLRGRAERLGRSGTRGRGPFAADQCDLGAGTGALAGRLIRATVAAGVLATRLGVFAELVERGLTGRLLLSTALAVPAFAETSGIEKEKMTLGFSKLSDMAPLAMARETGFFEDDSLSVTLVATSNWKVLLDGSGDLDGAHILAGQPIAARSAMAPRPRW